ncbi:MAG TPA: YpmA family protein [Thermoanaerobacterales bacterium]|nr:YpmA family protein [Thermoanaerobacterales bacterium]
MQKNDRLEPIAKKELSINEELYELVDFLNKNLKDKNLIFGLTKGENSMIVSIYEV